MTPRRGLTVLGALLASASLAPGPAAVAAPVAVRHREGLTHGFLVIRSAAGEPLGDGEYLSQADGKEASIRLVFHFKDGSVHDEAITFTQQSVFALLDYHLRQSGLSFPRAIEAEIGPPQGEKGHRLVRVSHTDADGHRHTQQDTMEVPPDVANGLLPVLLKNLAPAGRAEVHLLAFRPDPKLVALELEPEGHDDVIAGGRRQDAIRYRGHVHLDRIVAALARLADKEPPDVHIWVLAGDFPAYLRSEAPLFVEGPLWQIELASPHWPAGPAPPSGAKSLEIKAN